MMVANANPGVQTHPWRNHEEVSLLEDSGASVIAGASSKNQKYNLTFNFQCGTFFILKGVVEQDRFGLAMQF